MFGVDDKKFSDLEVAQAYWDRMKTRMEWCRNAAREYLEKNPRRKFYKLSYYVDSGSQTTYSDIDDADRQVIQEEYNKIIAEEVPFENSEQRADALSCFIDELDICWIDYVPEKDRHWAGGPPSVTDVDFDDFIHCCCFKIKHTEYFRDDKEALYDDYVDIRISDDEYVDMLAAKLFDKHLTFYDLKYINKDLFDRINDVCQRPHEHHVIFMEEINKVAKAIVDGTPKEELPPPMSDNMFTGVIMNIIFKNEDKFDDPHLMEALKLASCK